MRAYAARYSLRFARLAAVGAERPAVPLRVLRGEVPGAVVGVVRLRGDPRARLPGVCRLSPHAPSDSQAPAWMFRNSSVIHWLGGQPASARNSRARCAWSKYPQAAARSARWYPLLWALVARRCRARSKRTTRAAAFGVRPISVRNRLVRWRSEEHTSELQSQS